MCSLWLKLGTYVVGQTGVIVGQNGSIVGQTGNIVGQSGVIMGQNGFIVYLSGLYGTFVLLRTKRTLLGSKILCLVFMNDAFANYINR